MMSVHCDNSEAAQGVETHSSAPGPTEALVIKASFCVRASGSTLWIQISIDFILELCVSEYLCV